MIPASNIYNLKIEEVRLPSLTYKIDESANYLSGMIDGLEAVKQSAGLILSTERYAYPIYNWRYGTEIESLIGKPYEFVVAEIKRRIMEALLQDDRITDIINFKFNRQGDELVAEFEIISEYGNFDIKKVVNF